MKPLVSIIVPVYNVEKYIRKCIESIVNQTLKNIEIIIVNDGSTDSSLSILKEFEKDKRIKVINQRNRGVSAARNNGMDIACGEFIGFIDSDDYIELDMYEKMYKKAKKYNTDIVVANVKDVWEDNCKISLDIKDELININNDKLEEFFVNYYFRLGNAVWHKIFKGSLIRDNEIKFKNYNEVASEDTIFNIQAMLKSKVIYCMEEPVYYYLRRESSLTNSMNGNRDMIKRCDNTVSILNEYCEENKINANNFINYVTYWQLINGLSYSRPLTINSIIRDIRIYSKNKLFKDSLKKIAFTSKLQIYFKAEKNDYSKIYEYFDKIFAAMCYFNRYKIAAIIYWLRIKRANNIIKK